MGAKFCASNRTCKNMCDAECVTFRKKQKKITNEEEERRNAAKKSMNGKANMNGHKKKKPSYKDRTPVSRRRSSSMRKNDVRANAPFPSPMRKDEPIFDVD